MIEVHPNLFVGNQLDYETKIRGKDSNWNVVQACKEPYHRAALGYVGMAGPRDHAEYLFCYRQEGDCRRLILNMVDAPKPEFFPDAMMSEAITFITASMAIEVKTLVHCNQGASRSPSLAMLYLRRHTDTFVGMEFTDAEDKLRSLYPPYVPGRGIRAYVQKHWCDEPVK